LYVQDIPQEAFRWNGIMLADLTHPEDPSVTFAKTGSLTKDDKEHAFVLTLTDGSTHVVSQRSPDRYSFDTFETTTISVPMPDLSPKRETSSVTELPTPRLW